MEEYFTYPCQRCGNCCRHIDLIAEMKIFDRGDGICVNLTENNLCKIYSERPTICNGKFVYENFYSHIPVKDFHKIISKLCQKLQEMKT